MRLSSRLAVAAVAALALADAGIVALALPPILRELDTTVSGVAAVLGVYAVVLAMALPFAAVAARRGAASTGAAGAALFAAASLGCGLAGDLGVLLALRGVQALGGATVLVAAFALLRGQDGTGTRGWRTAALLGTAAGPALGGALTEAFGWRSIFLVQAPLALATVPAFLAARRASAAAPGGGAAHAAPAAVPLSPAGRALALGALVALSGALAAVLFLSVLLLVTGWSEEPLAAAATVSILPLAALAGLPIHAAPRARAVLGSLLVGAGTACLALVPQADLAWFVVPQAVAGFGMGLALPALAGGLLPERGVTDAASLLCARHVGIAVALVVLAPVITDALDRSLQQARERGAALILDARISPQAKLEVAPSLAAAVDTEQPRDGLRRAFATRAGDVDADQRPAFAALAARADETLVAAVDEAFAPGFEVGAALAALAALLALLAPPAEARARRPARAAALAAAAAAVAAVPVVYAALAAPREPRPVAIADPCAADRDLPATGGLSGVLQDGALVALDRVACKAGSSREALVLAMADDGAAQRYERRYGVDPRSAGDLLQAALGL
ncbi:MAG TPA: MFS transporter [Solirubrobacteraceae bacterium]|nr:MFS transporter [Solirubrobacteraceae bacterium]